jgi:methionyl-tRNA formyltransferase
MRVVVLTTGGDYGAAVVAGLVERAVPIGAIVLDLYRPRLRVALRRPRRLVGPLRRWLGARGLRRFAPLHVVGNQNGRRSVELLRSLAPDLLVLAGARILSDTILAVPTLGALNAHPAHLPGPRGTGVVGRSILGSLPVTVTVHFVAPELDAGDVVERRLVPIEPGDTLADIQQRADRLCAAALTDVVARAWRGEELPRERQTQPGQVGRWLDDEERTRAEELIAAGDALRRYREAEHG